MLAFTMAALLPVTFGIGVALGHLFGRRTEAMYRRQIVRTAIDRALEHHRVTASVRVEQPASAGGFEADNTVSPQPVRVVHVA